MIRFDIQLLYDLKLYDVHYLDSIRFSKNIGKSPFHNGKWYTYTNRANPRIYFILLIKKYISTHIRTYTSIISIIWRINEWNIIKISKVVELQCTYIHSSQFQSLCSTKCRTKMLQTISIQKNRKGFRLWQILKCFVGTFRQTQTVKLRGVDS